jgi:hypothetical protein
VRSFAELRSETAIRTLELSNARRLLLVPVASADIPCCGRQSGALRGSISPIVVVKPDAAAGDPARS